MTYMTRIMNKCKKYDVMNVYIICADTKYHTHKVSHTKYHTHKVSHTTHKYSHTTHNVSYKQCYTPPSFIHHLQFHTSHSLIYHPQFHTAPTESFMIQISCSTQFDKPPLYHTPPSFIHHLQVHAPLTGSYTTYRFIHHPISYGTPFHAVPTVSYSTPSFIQQPVSYSTISYSTQFHTAPSFIQHPVSYSTQFHTAPSVIQHQVSYSTHSSYSTQFDTSPIKCQTISLHYSPPTQYHIKYTPHTACRVSHHLTAITQQAPVFDLYHHCLDSYCPVTLKCCYY